MGILAQRLCQILYINSRRAKIIEQDVSHRLATRRRKAVNENPLHRLKIEVFTISSRARDYIESILISDQENSPIARYIVKTAQHISEPKAVQLASKQGVGPRVFDVEGKGRKAIILEEGLPDERCIVTRPIKKNEINHYGNYLSTFFLAFISLEKNSLLYHNDFRPEHVYILGRGKNIGIKLIDWGRGRNLWPLNEIENWCSELLDSFHLSFSLKNPTIWKLFINSLVGQIKNNSSLMKLNLIQHLSNAHMELIKSQILPITSIHQQSHKPFAIRFLEFIIKSRPLNLNLGVWDKFFEANARLKGEALANRCQDFHAGLKLQ